VFQRRLHNLGDALQFVNKAKGLCYEYKVSEYLGLTYLNMSAIEIEAERFKSAQEHARKAVNHNYNLLQRLQYKPDGVSGQ
jgi:hypothetical protein